MNKTVKTICKVLGIEALVIGVAAITLKLAGKELSINLYDKDDLDNLDDMFDYEDEDDIDEMYVDDLDDEDEHDEYVFNAD
jgi:hypothetical protein